ncbi:MAG: hypothetical protein AAGG51_23505 [Cyanobacteria bacterium P01_G01_bin.54]
MQMNPMEQFQDQTLNSSLDASNPNGVTANVAADAQASVQDADWFTLARKLRQRNRELLKRVADLEQALAQMQDELDGEAPRSASLASLALLPPEKALQNAQDQVDQLCQELEESHSVAQRQQFLIESLAQQLEATQAQLAHWEREYLAAQQRQQQQVELLAQATENARTLNEQLQRQQTQVAQFKTTLTECFSQAEAVPPTATSQVAAIARPGVTTESILPSPSQSGESRPSESTTPQQPTPNPSPLPEPSISTLNTIQPWSVQHPAPAADPPTWASRLLGAELSPPEAAAPPAVVPTVAPTTPSTAAPTAKPGLKSHLPIPRSAPAGKFANLLLPAFNGETTTPKRILRQPSRPVAPLAPPTVTTGSRKLDSVAAVNLPSFPRQ